jgi:hypothetical protein
MATGRLFATALVYLVNQWLVSRLHKRPLQLVTSADGEEDGELRHRFIKVEKTLSGRATEVTFHYVESSAATGNALFSCTALWTPGGYGAISSPAMPIVITWWPLI